MELLKIFFAIIFPLTVFSQNAEFRLNEKSNSNGLLFSKSNYILFDSLETKKEPNIKPSKKSPGLAFIYGLLIPGMGHVYAGRFETGKYFMISEAAIWLTYAAFSIYGNWLIDDAYDYAVLHAGISLADKDRDDNFFVDIANYNSVDEYNDEKLRFGEYDKLYFPELGYGFYWDSEENRRIYREDKIAGDRTLNDRLFVVGAVLINHLISGISAVFAANSYNDELKKKSSGGFSLRAGVQKHFNRIDGIKLRFTKWF